MYIHVSMRILKQNNNLLIFLLKKRQGHVGINYVVFFCLAIPPLKLYALVFLKAMQTNFVTKVIQWH